MGALGDEDIEIVDAATQVKIAPKRIAEEEAAETRRSPVTPSDEQTRTSTLLLEVERSGSHVPAQDGQRLAPHARGRGRDRQAHRDTASTRSSARSSTRPIAVREIIDLGDKLRKHKIRVKDIIRDAEDDDAGVRRGRGGPPHHPPHRQGQAPRQEAPGPARRAQARDRRASRKKRIDDRDRDAPHEDWSRRSRRCASTRRRSTRSSSS